MTAPGIQHYWCERPGWRNDAGWASRAKAGTALALPASRLAASKIAIFRRPVVTFGGWSTSAGINVGMKPQPNQRALN
jgi:hypothetical protein